MGLDYHSSLQDWNFLWVSRPCPTIPLIRMVPIHEHVGPKPEITSSFGTMCKAPRRDSLWITSGVLKVPFRSGIVGWALKCRENIAKMESLSSTVKGSNLLFSSTFVPAMDIGTFQKSDLLVADELALIPSIFPGWVLAIELLQGNTWLAFGSSRRLAFFDELLA